MYIHGLWCVGEVGGCDRNGMESPLTAKYQVTQRAKGTQYMQLLEILVMRKQQSKKEHFLTRRL